MHESERVLARAHALASDYLGGLADRPVAQPVAVSALRAALGGALPDAGEDPVGVLERLAAAADSGLVASSGPRYFGFVTGGALPAAIGAEWLASVWDQNAAMYVGSPAAAVAEEVAGRWLTELLGLPQSCSVGFTTGATMANFVALAAARSSVLAQVGHDVEELGLAAAPEVSVVAGESAHATVLAAVQMLGLGRARVIRVAADEMGRMRADEMRRVLASRAGPVIVCAQAGEVNTGSFDPFDAIADVVEERGAWLHVDGAFGLWSAASPALRHHVRGVERAHSWTVDGHKWLNVPYDSGYVLVRDPLVHRRAMSLGAEYYVESGAERDGFHYVPESSRRARGFATWAALRSLGRRGVAELVERSCLLARRMAAELSAVDGVEILNDVVLNQVLVRFHVAGMDSDSLTRDVIRRVQDEGSCWLGGTTWRGVAAARISVSNAGTSESDIDRSSAAILSCYAAAMGGE